MELNHHKWSRIVIILRLWYKRKIVLKWNNSQQPVAVTWVVRLVGHKLPALLPSL